MAATPGPTDEETNKELYAAYLRDGFVVLPWQIKKDWMEAEIRGQFWHLKDAAINSGDRIELPKLNNGFADHLMVNAPWIRLVELIMSGRRYIEAPACSYIFPPGYQAQELVRDQDIDDALSVDTVFEEPDYEQDPYLDAIHIFIGCSDASEFPEIGGLWVVPGTQYTSHPRDRPADKKKKLVLLDKGDVLVLNARVSHFDCDNGRRLQGRSRKWTKAIFAQSRSYIWIRFGTRHSKEEMLQLYEDLLKMRLDDIGRNLHLRIAGEPWTIGQRKRVMAFAQPHSE
jgi:hypothetical protein